MKYRRRASGLLAPEEGLAVLRLRGARGWDPASLGTLVGAKPPGGPGEDFTQRASLQCYYKFENASDLGEDYKGNIALTNTNAVTQSATIPSGTYAAPTATKSADFEADSAQYLTAIHDDAQEIDNLTALTMLMWYRPESVPTDGPILIDMADNGCTGGWRWYTTSTGTAVTPCFGGTSSGSGNQGMFSAGVWSFIAMTYGQDTDQIRTFKGTEEVQVVQKQAVAAVDKTAATTMGFFVGRYHGGSLYADGLMCELAVFSERLELADLQDIQQYGMDGSG